MADTTGTDEDNIWPMPKFNFRVKLGNEMDAVGFQEATGLEAEMKRVSFKKDANKQTSSRRKKAKASFSSVLLKRGIFSNKTSFWGWYNMVQRNTAKRETITIELINEKEEPTMTWSLLNAWPVKVNTAAVKSDGNEVVVESIELGHEGLTVTSDKN